MDQISPIQVVKPDYPPHEIHDGRRELDVRMPRNPSVRGKPDEGELVHQFLQWSPILESIRGRDTPTVQ
jgi:hypothetical protein